MLGPGIPKTLRQDTHLSCCVQSKVAAVHACVPELKRRRAELEAELAISIARHQVLTDELPWHKQLVRPQHYAASDSEECYGIRLLSESIPSLAKAVTLLGRPLLQSQYTTPYTAGMSWYQR